MKTKAIITKRGKKVEQFAQQKWQSKQVVGYRKNCADRRRSTNDKECRLCVYGNFDSLNKAFNFKVKSIKK